MLVVTVLLLAWSALGMVLSPRMLAGRGWTQRWPRVALAAWGFTLLTGIACVVTSLAIVLHTARGLEMLPPGTPLHPSLVLTTLTVSLEGCVLTALVGGLVGLVIVRALPLVQHRLETRRVLMRATRQTLTGMCDGVPVLEVDDERPLARSVPGRHPMILVSSGLRRALDDAEVDAVIAHERAHLSQHHDAIALLAALQRSCAPALPCSRSLEQSVAVLLELAADDVAARRHGARVTASALDKVARIERDLGAHLRSCRLEQALGAGGRPR